MFIEIVRNIDINDFLVYLSSFHVLLYRFGQVLYSLIVELYCLKAMLLHNPFDLIECVNDILALLFVPLFSDVPLEISEEIKTHKTIEHHLLELCPALLHLFENLFMLGKLLSYLKYTVLYDLLLLKLLLKLSL